MKEKIKFTDEPMGKVWIFSRKKQKKYNTQYQKMIRRLLDEYVARQLWGSITLPWRPGGISAVLHCHRKRPYQAVTESIHTLKEIFQNGHPTNIQHH